MEHSRKRHGQNYPDPVESPLVTHAAGHFAYRHTYETVRENPPDHLLVWVVAGDMDLSIGGRTHRAGAGDLVLFPPGLPHRYTPLGHTWEWFWLHAGGPAAATAWRRLSLDGPVRRLGQDARIRERFAELVSRAATAGLTLVGTPGQAAPTARLVADSCAFSLLGMIIERAERAQPATAGDPGLAGLTGWILDHLAEPLDVPQLAERSGWSTAHLHRLVRAEFGTSPMRLVHQLRMERAERLLRETAMPVGEVARLVGFNDPLHFSRRYRAWSGEPPSRTAGRQRPKPPAQPRRITP